MIVVADTSPLNYLLQIGHIDIVRHLYGSVIMPDAVYRELHAEGAPLVVRLWAESLPDWASVQRPAAVVLPSLTNLDPGETEALQLALQLHAALGLIDERRGSLAARELGLQTTGTLGVIRSGHIVSLVDGRTAYELLRQTTNFRIAQSAAELFLKSLP